jgi:ribosomal protein L13
MTTGEITTEIVSEALRVNVNERKSVVVVPAVRVTITGAKAEVSGCVHVVAYTRESSTVHYYEILVDSWSVDMKRDDLQRMVENVAARARARAEEYIEALKMLTTLNVEVNFRYGVANKSWLPEWLQKYIE